MNNLTFWLMSYSFIISVSQQLITPGSTEKVHLWPARLRDEPQANANFSAKPPLHSPTSAPAPPASTNPQTLSREMPRVSVALTQPSQTESANSLDRTVKTGYNAWVKVMLLCLTTLSDSIIFISENFFLEGLSETHSLFIFSGNYRNCLIFSNLFPQKCIVLQMRRHVNNPRCGSDLWFVTHCFLFLFIYLNK